MFHTIFYVFQPFVPLEDTLEHGTEQGLKMPSIRVVEISMLTFDELVTALAHTKNDEQQATIPSATDQTNEGHSPLSKGEPNWAAPLCLTLALISSYGHWV